VETGTQWFFSFFLGIYLKVFARNLDLNEQHGVMGVLINLCQKKILSK
jgi:hypothetical protein